MKKPTIEVSRFVSAGPLLGTVVEGDGGRVLTTGIAAFPTIAVPSILGVEAVEGYNSLQLRRYWTLVRALDEEPLRYGTSVFEDSYPAALDLLQITWVITTADAPPPGSTTIQKRGARALYYVEQPVPRAFVASSWSNARSSGEALDTVLRRDRSGSQGVIAEGAPNPPGGQVGDPLTVNGASYEPLGTQAARVDVTTSRTALLVVRNIYDQNWRAEIDERPAQIFAVDYINQGVVIPPGRHTVLFTYHDPWVGRGLAGSGIALVLLLGAALITAAKENRRKSTHTHRTGPTS